MFRAAARAVLDKYPRLRKVREWQRQVQSHGMLVEPTAVDDSAGRLESELSKKRERIDYLESRLGHVEAQWRISKYYWNMFKWRYATAAAEIWGQPQRLPVPIREMPLELHADFTMNGRIPVAEAWSNDTTPVNYPLIYSDAEIDCYIERIKNGKPSLYTDVDAALPKAFRRFPIAGQSIAVIGSITPWYEAMCLHFGGSPTTIEYRPIISRTSRLKTLTVTEYAKCPIVFDAAVNISSIEHDGLGRYGDPIDPDGDLKAMQKMKSMITRGGLMYFAVPIGQDTIWWNSHRVYGRTRLPVLLKGWETVASFGFNETLFDQCDSPQPIFVLRNV